MRQKIKTTRSKAKETKVLLDRLITIAKRQSPFYQRMAFSLLPDKKVIKELFKEIAPRFKNRTGGYTRIIPLDFRKGDGADMVILELTEQKIISKPEKGKSAKEKSKEKKLSPKKEVPPKPEEKAPEQKVAPKPKAEVAEEIAREKAKTEGKKVQKNFLKGLRRFFRGKAP